jgi:hypothetical protein
MASDNITCFKGFSWAVPTGFQSALAACRFEKGDLLHNSADAYNKPWDGNTSKFRYSVQVQTAVNTAPGAEDSEEPATDAEPAAELDIESENDSDVDPGKPKETAFKDSWDQEITISLTDHSNQKTRLIATTQGRLYSVLWKGDLNAFDGTTNTPPRPFTAGALRPELPVAAERINKKYFAEEDGGYAFLFPVDHASTAQTLKARIVESALRSLGEVTSRTLSPETAKIESGFCPTIQLHCYAVTSGTEESITAALKAKLYKPAPDRKTDKDMFKLTSHGCLFKLGLATQRDLFSA